MVIATLVLVLSSPILVPSMGVLTMVTTGFLFSGCCPVAAMVAIACMYRYVGRKKVLAMEQLGCLREM
ncbi:hypothetical protein CDL12_02543 [Handroanthus impetiginosus]|uniref:Uncharacterized protein n=1 Tax=Handroanthus impetiginosus TaxID=429701 RepID=A0A2G9I528_9LAMI|nr:hypothetical protein CDL12_02543 [Handroanthus impetiginosus]